MRKILILILLNCCFLKGFTQENVAKLSRADSTFIKKAEDYKHNGDYENAIKYYTQAILIYQDGQSFMERGWCYYSIKDYENCYNDFYKAIEVDPYNYELHSYAAQSIKGYPNRDLKSAIKILDNVIKNDPNGKYYSQRGDYKEDEDYADYNGAIEDFKIALQKDSYSYDLYTSLSNCYFHLKDYSQAVYYMTKYIDNDPKGYEICKQYYWRGIYKSYLEDYRGAVTDFNASLIKQCVFPRPYEINLALGKCYYFLNNYKSSLVYLNRGLSQFSKDNSIVYYSDGTSGKDKEFLAEVYYFRGLVKIELKIKGEACLDLSKAGEMGVSDAYKVIQEKCK